MQEQAFIISRIYDAPRDLVFSCFTEVRHLARWWGPRGITIVNAALDFRPGGLFHYGMKWPDGSIMWARFTFRDIVVPEKIVFLNAFSDEAGGLTRAPFFDGKWPLEVLSVFAFEALSPGRTRFTVTSTPHNATAIERAEFAVNTASMEGGWSGTLEKLDDYLTTINN